MLKEQAPIFAAVLALAVSGCSDVQEQEQDQSALSGPLGLDRIARAARQAEAEAKKGIIDFNPPQRSLKELWAVLTPFGRWIEVPVYGKVWQPSPRIVGEGWIPYTQGRWVYTKCGWTWVSDFKDWGWAAFHFGRFALSPIAGWSLEEGRPDEMIKLPSAARTHTKDQERKAGKIRKIRPGWVWIPDTAWSPAHVGWREGQNYVGWGPLPPGYSVNEDVQRGTAPNIPRDAWIFVEKQYFAAGDLFRHLRPRRQQDLLLRLTSRIRQWKQLKGRAVYLGPHHVSLEEEVGLDISLMDFAMLARQYGSRILPEGFEEQPGTRRARVAPTEVRPDVDRTVVIAGPNSPRELSARKVVRVYEQPAPTTPTKSSSTSTKSRPTPPSKKRE